VGGETREAARANGAGGAHLDADEMNAYAEGAVPDVSRARYVAHLADCDECRGLVTQLTLAANVVTAASEPAVAAASASPARSWREWLATLFAPPVLRYAVPAIALMAVMLVAFVALRRERGSDNVVARNEQPQAGAQATPDVQFDKPSTAGTAATSNTAATTAPVGENSANANVNARANNPREADAPATVAPAQERAGEQSAVAPKNAPQPTAQPARDSDAVLARPQGSYDDKSVEVEKPAPPPPSVDLAAARKTPEGNDGAVFREENTQKSAGGATKAKASAPASTPGNNNYVIDGVASNAQSGARRPAESAGRRARGVANNADRASSETTGPDAKDERGRKEDGERETRSAGGRQFSRRGGAWVDTAYSPSRSTVNVRRNSEQYRALVADEPGIGHIADQLGGTVIIVWKSRAYRIY
jgi:hypothetical protein